MESVHDFSLLVVTVCLTSKECIQALANGKRIATPCIQALSINQSIWFCSCVHPQVMNVFMEYEMQYTVTLFLKNKNKNHKTKTGFLKNQS